MTSATTIERCWCYYRNLVHTCYREARHLGAPADSHAKLEVDDPDLQRAMAGIRKWRDRLMDGSIFEKVASKTSTADIRKPWEEVTALTLAQLPDLFARDGWAPSYGGRRWAHIVELTLKLGDALDVGDDTSGSRLCDEIRTVEHNSGRLVPASVGEQQARPGKWPQPCD